MEKEQLLQNTALYKFWERAGNTLKCKKGEISSTDWNEQMYHLSKYGRGMEEALHYLFIQQPSYDLFADWLLATYQPDTLPEPQEENVLTEADHAFWKQNGYIVVKNAISTAACTRARNAIWEHLDASEAAPETWYKQHDSKKGMMLNFFQHPALIANRNSARIRKVYEELYGSRDIYMLMDKVSFNPPETDDYNFVGSKLHWDVSLKLPIPFALQGLVYLNDVDATEGAFHCVPGFHNIIEEWLNGLPEGTDPRVVAPELLQAVPVAGNAGDLVVWHHALAHCATANKGTQARMVQYIAYKPRETGEHTEWK